MNNIQNARGFTLATVLIGLVVLSIGLLGAARLVIVVAQSNAFSTHLTTATTLAQDQIAAVQRLGYANADTAAGPEPYGTIANYGDYQRVTAVSPNTPAAGMKTVTVTVTWQSRSDTHSVIVPTLLAR
jgi:Tfp pilus assembly protein PilV